METIEYPIQILTVTEKLNLLIAKGRELRDAERKLSGMERGLRPATQSEVNEHRVQIVKLQTEFDLMLQKYEVK
jgi:hypothetical protein